MDKKGNGWLRRECVAKLDGNGWLSSREMGGSSKKKRKMKTMMNFWRSGSALVKGIVSRGGYIYYGLQSDADTRIFCFIRKKW